MDDNSAVIDSQTLGLEDSVGFEVWKRDTMTSRVVKLLCADNPIEFIKTLAPSDQLPGMPS